MKLTVPPAVARAANSEVRKVTSVRINRVIGGGVVLAGIAAFVALGMGFQPGGEHEEGFSTGSGWAALLTTWVLVLTVAAAAAFGALGSASEFRYGSMAIGALFTDRTLLLGSKLAVAGAFSLGTVLFMEVLGGAAMRIAGGSRVPMDSGFFGVLLGVPLAALCWAVIGTALGFVLRSPTQALAAVLGWAVLEPLIWITARAIGIGGLAAVLPVASTVGAISGGRYAKSALIAPTPAAMALLVLWTAAAGAAGWWLFTRRDI
ncbi:ABC transporter permease [Nocardia sp. CDC153]|uniref:ABC transporter permease n=1 Tax=Nocardia sp. CDC153 TaxID=3112167 RepID=UPI002DB58505|nr:ABC transporter permease [Nocardia sp. CDC153]MEC3952205.1 ABC transporter permease [Nocardia sp. CDC153]